MKTRTSLLLALCTAAFALPLAAKVATGYLPRTGDTALDANLVAIDDMARAANGAMVDAMVAEFGSPRYLLRDYLEKKRWAPGDVYCACAIAYQLQRPCVDILREYEPHRSEGWSAFVRRFGLLPGSQGFETLKDRIDKARLKLAPPQEPGIKADVADEAAAAANRQGKK